MLAYDRITDPINLVDFSKDHDEDNYLHYSFAVIVDGKRRGKMYESIEKNSKSVVYRGGSSYWERRSPKEYKYKMLKRRSDFNEISRKLKNDILDEEEYVNISAEELLQQKMREMLTNSIET
jgi:hypothetical protein